MGDPLVGVASRRDALLGLASMTAAASLASSGRAFPFSRPPTIAARGDVLRPFRVEVPQAHLDALQRQLDAVIWPDMETEPGWGEGVPLATAREVIEYWRQHHDWRRFEAKINAYPQFVTTIFDLDIHFIHVRSPHAGALPLILTHGWPGSIVEFLGVIGPLTDPTRYGGRADQAFDVVVPSLPGYGFSGRPRDRGWNLERTARAWAVLMQRLGYLRWAAQGGDWGSGLVHTLARQQPPGLLAVHTNWPMVVPDRRPDVMSAKEHQAWDDIARYQSDGSGYWREQGTRPQTLGYALAGSPVGLAMWMLEKFHAWTDQHAGIYGGLSLDSILDDIDVYWFTNTMTSSSRMYLESAPHGPGPFNLGKISIPMAASIFPSEIFRPSEAWARKLWSELIYWNEVDRGGHFAAFEQPALFTSELRRAFEHIRTS